MNLQVGVKVLIKNSKDEYLFIRRTASLSTDKKGTSWDIPGGRIEPDEYLLDALKREVKEEVGYELQSEPTLIAAQDIFVPEKDLHVVRLTYTLLEDVMDVSLSEEHQEHIWIHQSKLQEVAVEPYLTEVLQTKYQLLVS